VNPLKELKKGSAIFVTGTPGTGKTTISSALAKRLHARHINPAESLSQRHMLRTWDKKRRTAVVSPTRLRSHVVSLAKRADQGLVIDTHIMFGLPNFVRVRRVFVLRCDPDSLEKRLRHKGWTRQKIHENALAEILDICLWDAVERYGERRISEIDTTDMTPHAVVGLALRELKMRQPKTQPEVDWLLTLENERRLDRYVK